METLSPYLWDLTHWARTAGSGAAALLPQSRPQVGARVASPHCSVLRLSEEKRSGNRCRRATPDNSLAYSCSVQFSSDPFSTQSGVRMSWKNLIYRVPDRSAEPAMRNFTCRHLMSSIRVSRCGFACLETNPQMLSQLGLFYKPFAARQATTGHNRSKGKQ